MIEVSFLRLKFIVIRTEPKGSVGYLKLLAGDCLLHGGYDVGGTETVLVHQEVLRADLTELILHQFCEAKFVSMPISPALLFKRKSSSVGTYAAVTVSIQVSFSLILITILRKSDSRINDSIENIHYQHNDNVHCRIYKAQ